MIDNLIVIAVVAVIIGAALLYIYKEKKSGAKCIGCPHSKCCSSAKNGGNGCCGCSGSPNK